MLSVGVGGGCGLVVVLSALLHLNKTPSSRLWVADVLWYTGDTDGVRHQLHLILHAGGELARLCVAVDVHLLCPAGDDEDGDFTRVQHACADNVDVADIEDLAVRLEAGGEVLLRQGLVHGVLRLGKPELERLNVTLDVGVEDLGQNVFAELLQEGLRSEAGVHCAELLNDLGRLVLGEPSSNLVRDESRGLDEGVFGFAVDLAGAEESLGELVRVLELVPCLLPGSVLVDRDVGAGASSVSKEP